MKAQGPGKSSGLVAYFKNGYRTLKYGVKFSTLMRAMNYVVGRRFKKYDELDSFNRLQLLKLYLFADVFTHLLKKHPVDFAAIMFPQPDQLGHKFWAFMEPEKYEKRTGELISQEDRKKYGNVIYNCYAELDKVIGEVSKTLTDEDVIMVLSDHGFGLVQRSFASLKIKGKRFLEILGLNNLANCFSVGINFIIKLNKVNLDVDLAEIANEIAEIKTIDDNEPLFKVTHDEYEIVLELRTIFSMYLDDARAFLEKKIKIKDQIIPANEILINRSDITGEHRDTGILVMKGKNIKRNTKIEHASVLDIVPTILYLKNLPVAHDMDGKVLQDAIENQYLSKHPIQFIETYESESVAYYDKETDFSMTEELESRLKDLGYLD